MGIIKRKYNLIKVILLVLGTVLSWWVLGELILKIFDRYYLEHFLMLSILAIPYLILHLFLKGYDLFYPKSIGKLEKWTGTYSYTEIFHQLDLACNEEDAPFERVTKLKSAIWKYCDYNKDNLLSLLIILNSLKDTKEKDKITAIFASIITGVMFIALKNGMIQGHIFTIMALSKSELLYYNVLAIVLMGVVLILALIKTDSGEYKSITLLANLTNEMYQGKFEK